MLYKCSCRLNNGVESHDSTKIAYFYVFIGLNKIYFQKKTLRQIDMVECLSNQSAQPKIIFLFGCLSGELQDCFCVGGFEGDVAADFRSVVFVESLDEERNVGVGDAELVNGHGESERFEEVAQ